MIISKELFIQTIMDIQKEREFQDRLNDIFDEYCDDSMFMHFHLENTIVNLLEEMFKDEKNNWIAYALYELDMLTKYKDGCITDENGNNIAISDFGKLYDFLIDNMKRE